MWQSRVCPSPGDYLGVRGSVGGNLGVFGIPGKFGSPWESWESLRLQGSPGGREECVAVQGLSEPWGLSGSPGECRGDLGVFGSPGKFGSPWESAINAVVSAWKRPWFITPRSPGPFEGHYKAL